MSASQRNLSIKAQLRLAFLLILCLLAGSALLVENRLRVVNEQSTEMAANWMPSIIAVNAINTATSDFRIAEGLHILSTTDAEMTGHEQTMARLAKEIAGWRVKYKALISSEEERALYQSFTRKYDEYLAASKKTLALSRRNQNVQAASQLKSSGLLFDSMSDELLKLVKLNTDGGEKASAQGDVIYAETQTMMLWLGAVALLLVTVLPWVLERRIVPRVGSKPAPSSLASELLSLHYRRPTLVLIVMTALMVITVSVLSQRLFSGLTVKVEEDQLSLVRSAVNYSLQNAQIRALSRAEMVADLPRARALLAAGDRAGLLTEFRRMFQTQNDKYGVDQAQFHLSPATSFLNLHTPEVFGEDLSKSRPMLVTANRERLPQAGFSITNSGPGIFGVAPMFDDANRHIGSFETGVTLVDVGDGLKNALGLEVTVFVDEDALWENAKGLDKAVFSAQNRAGQYIRYYSTNAALMKELVATADLNDPSIQYTRSASGDHYGVVLTPLYSDSGQVKGVVAAAKELGSLRSDESRSVVWQILMAVISIVVLAGGILIVIRGTLAESLAGISSDVGRLRENDESQP